MDKRKILSDLMQAGWRPADIQPYLSPITEDKLKVALELIRNLRAEALHQNIPPILTRVALKYALAADTYACEKGGHNLHLINRLTEMILLDLLEGITS